MNKLLFIISCNSKSQLKKDLALLQSKEIVLPIAQMKHQVAGKDIILKDFADADLKLVVYTDSTGCSSCSLSKMFLWDDIIEKTDKYNGRLKYYFIFSPSKSALT